MTDNIGLSSPLGGRFRFARAAGGARDEQSALE
jgi:hypothetical protein